MSIKVGDRMPSGKLRTMTDAGPAEIATEQLFDGKRVLLFSVPGAYTPTCSQKHLPGYIAKAAELRAKGIDAVACMAVNDVFVMSAWGKSAGADGKVQMLADGSADFAKKIGLEIDLGARGMGFRSKRYSMVVDNGVVTVLNVEEAPPSHDKSSATNMLSCKF